MSAKDIPMCDYHLERRGMGRYDWPVPTEENPCYQCTTGMMPDWELPIDFRSDYPFDMDALEDHVARLLKEQYEPHQSD